MKLSFQSIGMRVGVAIGAVIVVLQGVMMYDDAVSAKQAAVDSEVLGARNLILMAESVRENMERKWELGLFSPATLRSVNAETATAEERKARILASVPVVAAWESAKAKAAEGGFEFRTPRHDARNRANEPDAVEAQALEFFERNPGASEHYVVDESMNAVRYFRPVRLGEVCMNCHGDPANSQRIWGRDDGRDITGFEMDGKKVGDLHGAFEVIRPLAGVDAQIRSDIAKSAMFSIVGLLLTLSVVGWLIVRIVSRPVRQAMQILEQAEGDSDLTLRLDDGGSGEIAMMSAAFNRFADRIRMFMQDVAGGSNQLASSAEEMSVLCTETSQGASAQQAETEQAATAMNEMTATVHEVARHAASAAQAADAASRDAEQGREVVLSSRVSIEALAAAVQDAATVIRHLADDSQAIGGVLDVIRGIAEQINLLALNAAIEAARAGEQGRGFAVVADEVRTLAKRTQDSTREIQDMIERVQLRADEAVEAMETGRRKVDSSVEQSEKVVETLTSIAEVIEVISDMNAQIAAASEEQSSVAEEVNRNVSRINGITGDTVSRAHKTDQGTERLAALAVTLREKVGQFRV